MEQERISGMQLVFLMFWAIMGTAILTLPVLIGIHAPRDAWTAAVIFTIGGLLLCLIIGYIGKLFPEKNLVMVVQDLFGIFIGKLFIIIFLIWLFYTTTLVFWQVTSFASLSLLPNTPFYVIMILLAVAPAYAVYSGLESIARCGEFIVILVASSLFIILFLLTIPDFQMTNLLPLFDDGVINILRASLSPLAWAGEIMFVLFLIPYVKGGGHKIGFYGAITIILIGMGGLINEIAYTAVFGPLRQYLINPFYILIRYISPTAFIERYDVFFVSLNLLGNFLKFAVFGYIFVLVLAQVLDLKSYRPLVLPSFAAIVFAANFTVNSTNELLYFLDRVFPLFTIPLLYGLPLLVLCTAVVKSKKRKYTNKY